MTPRKYRVVGSVFLLVVTVIRDSDHCAVEVTDLAQRHILHCRRRVPELWFDGNQAW